MLTMYLSLNLLTMERITNKMLENKIDYLNEITNSPKEPWSKGKNGKLRANIGNHHISGAYGGICVYRMVNDGGAVNTPIVFGHIPKRELYDRLCSYINGIEYGKKI